MNLFGLIAIAALVFCVPLAVVMEGSKWGAAYQGAISKVGKDIFLRDMALAGLFYHLYNQVSRGTECTPKRLNSRAIAGCSDGVLVGSMLIGQL